MVSIEVHQYPVTDSSITGRFKKNSEEKMCQFIIFGRSLSHLLFVDCANLTPIFYFHCFLLSKYCLCDGGP